MNIEKLFDKIYSVFYVFIIAIVLVLIVALFPIKGNIQIKIVKSGSMEPDIRTGAVVVIKPSSSYKEGDVVTFGKDTREDIPTTHRIVASRAVSGVMYYTTKGDANEDNDPREIRVNDIHGKVILDVPFFGYVIDFARKPVGFAVLIILPALIILYDEGAKIVAEIRKLKKKKDGESSEDIATEKTEKENEKNNA